MISSVRKKLKQSELIKFVKNLNNNKFPSYKTRKLEDEEITQLKSQQNSAENWGNILVASDFDATKVRSCRFSGQVVLPRFFGTIRIPDGLAVPTGLNNVDIQNSIIENSHISQVGAISNMIISAGVAIRNTGSLVCSGFSAFGVGRQLSIGPETGQRTIIAFPELDSEIANYILAHKHDEKLQHRYQTLIEEHRENLRCQIGFVGEDACILNTKGIRNVWIGKGTRIDGAVKIRNSCILSTLEQQTLIRDGALVEHSVVQWGARVDSHALVSESVLLEESSASKNLQMTHSIVGPNSHPCSASIACSVIGPYAGIHQRSQVISLLWPDGQGTIEAGVLIGGENYGRSPDREGFLGAGIFIGSGATLLQPFDLRESPWSTVAAGTRIHSQRISFPFSRIEGGDNLRVYPGWMLRNNPHGLTRSEFKFKERSKARRSEAKVKLISSETAMQVLQARKRLERISNLRDIYTSKEISGLGKGILSEKDRQIAIREYDFFLKRHALIAAIDKLSSNTRLLESTTPVVKSIFTGDLLRSICQVISIPANTEGIIESYLEVEKTWYAKALEALEGDVLEETEIFPEKEVPEHIDASYIDSERLDSLKKGEDLLKELHQRARQR